MRTTALAMLLLLTSCGVGHPHPAPLVHVPSLAPDCWEGWHLVIHPSGPSGCEPDDEPNPNAPVKVGA